jgi:glycosyltransferase involved in cell wall biosynthesis
VVRLSKEVIGPAKTISDIVERGTVIYHGAEPAITIDLSNSSSYQAKKNEFRKEFGLPEDKMLLLAFGYAGFYKGFDILDSISLPKDWKVVIKQGRHERGSEQPIQIRNAINLNLGYVDDNSLSKLFSACDAIIFPYRLVSVSGVLFDALAHGLPFVASDLEFFAEFAQMGLGVVCKRSGEAFSKGLQYLDENYRQYRQRVEQFAPTLQWNNIADRHIEVYSRDMSF